MGKTEPRKELTDLDFALWQVDRGDVLFDLPDRDRKRMRESLDTLAPMVERFGRGTRRYRARRPAHCTDRLPFPVDYQAVGRAYKRSGHAPWKLVEDATDTRFRWLEQLVVRVDQQQVGGSRMRLVGRAVELNLDPAGLDELRQVLTGRWSRISCGLVCDRDDDPLYLIRAADWLGVE